MIHDRYPPFNSDLCCCWKHEILKTQTPNTACINRKTFSTVCTYKWMYTSRWQQEIQLQIHVLMLEIAVFTSLLVLNVKWVILHRSTPAKCISTEGIQLKPANMTNPWGNANCSTMIKYIFSAKITKSRIFKNILVKFTWCLGFSKYFGDCF